MGQNDPSSAVGQVSADGQFRWDGQQWVAIPRGAREPTSWTRPMQLAAAGIFFVSAAISVIGTLAYVNHDSMLRAIQAQGTQIPQGTSIDQVVNIAIGVAIATVIIVALLEVFAGIGSLLGWRWMFWAALVLFGFGALGSLGNIGYFAKPDTSPMPTGVIVVDELFSLVELAMFVWLLMAAIRFGPWAMKRPGR